MIQSHMTTLKRTSDGDLNCQSKRQKKEALTLDRLPRDVLTTIFNSLEFDALAALSLTSKTWLKITNHPLTAARWWCDSKNINCDVSIQNALHHCYTVLLDPSSSAHEKMEMQERIAYLNVLHMCYEENSPPSSRQQIRRLLNALESAVTSVIRASVPVHIAYMCIRGYSNELTLDQTFGLLQNVIADQTLPVWLRIQAKVLLVINAKVPERLSKEQAIDLLTDIPHNPAANFWSRAQACCLLAGGLIDYTQLGSFPANPFAIELQNFCQNRLLSDDMKIKNKVIIATLRCKKYTDVISDSQLVDLVQDLAKNASSVELKALMELYLADLCIQKRAHALTDDEVTALLHDIRQRSSISVRLKTEATFKIANMQQQSPPDVLKDAEVVTLLQSIQQAPTIQDHERKAAKLQIISMQLAERTDVLEHAEIVSFLQDVRQNPNSLNSHKVAAELLMAHMQVNKPVDMLTDEEAVAVLQKVLQNPYALERSKIEAKICLAKMRVEKRTDRLTDEEAVTFLQNVQHNREANSRQQRRAEKLLKDFQQVNKKI